MNKKLLSLAVGAALASAPMFAQADTVLYGKVHVSIDAPDADTAGQADDVNITSNSSRLGVKGSEDLGNGLAAIYQYETRVNVSEESGDFFDGIRNAFLGLKGGFGTFLAGRHDTPMKDVSRSYDLFGDQVGDSRNVLVGGDPRWSNSLRYMTPKLGAFSAELQYSADTGGGVSGRNNDDNDFDGMSGNVRFDGGMFDVMAAYEVNNRGGVIPAGQTDDTDIFRIAGGVNFDPFRIVALWQTNSDESFVAGRDRDMWGIGAAMAMGNNRIKAQWYAADDADGAANSGADQFSIGFDHKFSKRTTAYAAYAMIDNEDNAAFVPWGGGHELVRGLGAGAGSEPSVFSVGMIHSF